jgi:hypothetical protein
MPGKRRPTRAALEAELRQREEELVQRDEELAWRRDGATPEQLNVVNEKLDYFKPGFYRLLDELEANRTELEARRAEKPAKTLARMRKGKIAKKIPYREHTFASEKLMGDIANLDLGEAEVARRIIRDCDHHGIKHPDNHAVEEWVRKFRRPKK